MPIFIIIGVGLVILVFTLANFLESPGTFLFFTLVYVVAAATIYGKYLKSDTYRDWQRGQARQAEATKQALAEEQHRQEAQTLADEWAMAPPLPTPVEFIDAIGRAAPSLNAELLDRILHMQEAIFYDAKVHLAQLQAHKLVLRPAEVRALYQQLATACVEGIRGFTNKLPSYLTETSPPSIFTQSINLTEDDLRIPAFELAKPLLNGPFRRLFDTAMMEPYDFMDRILARNYDDTASGTKQYEKDYKAYQKREEAILKAMRPIDKSLLSTPYYLHASYLYPAPIHGPFTITPQARFAGTWIVAPPGRGKTNLLHHMISEDRKEHATIVLMDSKGDLINAYRGLPDVVLIEPNTVEINPFQLGSSTRTLDFLEYIFSALLETKMTPKQTTLFRCVLALMLQIPNATIETFRRVLVHGWREHEPYVMQLDEDNRDFFCVEGRKSEFDGGQYQETKQEVLQRLRFLVSNKYLKRIFTVPQSNTNFFELLDSGKTIVIDNSKDELGETGAEFFGRFFVALVWMAAVSRSKLRPDQKVPVYFYIDECHTVIKRDTKITTILDECRSQKIALILAHQRIGQIEPNVMDALNNCAIRIANSDDDAEALAKRFRVDAPALRLPVGNFACFVRDQTAQARTVSVPEFDMSSLPPVSPPIYKARPSAPPLAPAPFKPPIVPKEPAPNPQPKNKGW
jgi:hypothetical protein